MALAFGRGYLLLLSKLCICFFSFVSIFFLGFLSHRYIEKIKFELVVSRLIHLFKCIPAYIALIIIFLGSIVFYGDGLSSRFLFPVNSAKTVKKINKQLVMPSRGNGYCFYSFTAGSDFVDAASGAECYLGDKSKRPLTLLFGDSYAGHNEPFWDEIFKSNNQSFQSISTNWCVPSLTNNFTGSKTHLAYQQCLLNREFLNENMRDYRNIIFAGSWDTVLDMGQFEDVIAVIDKASQLDINVFIMASPYRYKKNPLSNFYKSIYFDIPLSINTIPSKDAINAEANLLLKAIASNYKNVTYVGRDIIYSKDNKFLVNGISVPYSLDGGHISILGSKYSAKYFMKNAEYQNVMDKFDFN
ncbi:SGNH hydrolase domain-containing protein [Shewanella phaeophyticola]|uniref:SGNH hydrolase domain-containing protein n=1 Tax=Shewanella phaeophyticola TaxID=2978345 RepID=A0ABT2P3R1_9GAMM|nr:SGNH hydrolase domain-containing protein [Shewanella sp. KJ10-1]MCT8987036.1 SGNH hydrolase domain-containing protein [Shewanella sp. KJ10-1]